MTIAVSVQASPRNRESWLSLAAEVESAGFDGLYVGGHPGTTPDPFVSLAAAASVTERIRLGTCVLNAGTWEPLALVSAVATLDMLSNGRATLGVGAGHTPQEWTGQGRPFPPAGERIDRMMELVEATQALLTGDAPLFFRGTHFTLVDAAVTDPRPVQDHVPLTIGGNGRRVLRYAAQRADIVSVTGLGRTLDDGHRHEVDWTVSAIERTFDQIRSASTEAGRTPALEALVQHVEVTDDAAGAAARLAADAPGASASDLLSAPFVWIGTVAEIRAKLQDYQARFGLARYMVRAGAFPQVRQILAAIDQTAL